MTIAFYDLSLVEKAEIFQAHFTLESEGSTGPKTISWIEGLHGFLHGKPCQLKSWYKPFDERKGSSQIHGHGPWLVCEVALT